MHMPVPAPSWALAVIAAVAGVAVGSYLTVLADRALGDRVMGDPAPGDRVVGGAGTAPLPGPPVWKVRLPPRSLAASSEPCRPNPCPSLRVVKP